MSHYKDTALERYAIPEGSESVQGYEFMHCTNLKEVIIPEGVTVIGPGAFEGCTSLERIVLPESMKNIEGRAFFGCTNLKRCDIPSGIESIGEAAFWGTALKEAVVPATLRGDGAYGSGFDAFASTCEIVVCHEASACHYPGADVPGVRCVYIPSPWNDWKFPREKASAYFREMFGQRYSSGDQKHFRRRLTLYIAGDEQAEVNCLDVLATEWPDVEVECLYWHDDD